MADADQGHFDLMEAVVAAAQALRDACKQELGTMERMALRARKPEVAAKLAALEQAVARLEAGK